MKTKRNNRKPPPVKWVEISGPTIDGEEIGGMSPAGAPRPIAKLNMMTSPANGDHGRIVRMTPEVCTVESPEGKLAHYCWAEIHLVDVQPDPAQLNCGMVDLASDGIELPALEQAARDRQAIELYNRITKYFGFNVPLVRMIEAWIDTYNDGDDDQRAYMIARLCGFDIKKSIGPTPGS